MNRHVTWLMERERDAAAIYRTAATIFAHEPDFSSFLETLAGQEDDHGQFLQAVAESDSCPPSDELDRLFNPVTRNNMEGVLRAARNKLGAPHLTKGGMIELSVAMEFSEWNSLFLYVMNCAMQEGREFQQMAAEIERHRETLEQYLERAEESGEYLQIIRNLAPLWKKRILILDEDAGILKLLTVLMAPFGELVTTENGREALTQLRQGHFDAVISDVEMPEMTGIDFYRAATEIDPAIGRHFLFITGTMREDYLEFIRSNGLCQLRKPANLTAIRDTVARILHEGPAV